MACSCKYFRYQNGRLVCVECGMPSERPVMGHEVVEGNMPPPEEAKLDLETEDKVDHDIEDKTVTKSQVPGHIMDTDKKDLRIKRRKKR